MKTTVLGAHIASRTGSVTPANFPDEEFELYSIPAHDAGGPEVVAGFDIGSAKQNVQPGDVLLAKIIPHIRRVRVVAEYAGRRQIASGEWIVFRTDAYDPHYLRHFLLSDRFHVEFMNTVAGVGGSLVRARPEFVKKIGAPLPPFDEQRRIAAILDQADATCAKRISLGSLVDELHGSLTNDLLRDVPWSGSVADLAEVQIGPFGSLLHKSDYVSDGVSDGICLINPMHIQGGEIVPDSAFSVDSAKAAELETYRLRAGDVVLARRGEMGRAATAQAEHEGMLCGTGSVIVRPKLKGAGALLQALLSSTRMRDHLTRSSLGATLPNLNASIVKSAPAPAIDEQSVVKFKELTTAASNVRQGLRAAAAANEALFASLQSRAFKGEL